MKSLALALFMISGTALADVPVIVAKNVSCSKLKAEVEKYGSAVIVKRILGIKKRYEVKHDADCSSDERTVYGKFKTKTDKNCRVGQWCKSTWSVSYESSGGGYYDGGYYDSGSYGGSSSGSGSNYNPPSSGSSGSNYNPPSSGSTGSNYNPPSSGSRGSNYCPSC